MEQDVDWIRLEAWGRTAENIASMAQKGSRMAVLGRLAVSSWTDKYGQSRSDMRVRVRKVEILDMKPRSGSGGELKYNSIWEGGEQGAFDNSMMMDNSPNSGNYPPSRPSYTKRTYERGGGMMGRGGTPSPSAGGQRRVMYNNSGGGVMMAREVQSRPQTMEVGGGEDMYDIDTELPF